MTTIEKWGSDRPLQGSPMGRQWDELCHWQDSLQRRLDVVAAAATGFSGSRLLPDMAQAIVAVAEEVKALAASTWPGMGKTVPRLRVLQLEALNMRARMYRTATHWPEDSFVGLPGALASLCEESTLHAPPSPSMARWNENFGAQ